MYQLMSNVIIMPTCIPEHLRSYHGDEKLMSGLTDALAHHQQSVLARLDCWTHPNVVKYLFQSFSV